MHIYNDDFGALANLGAFAISGENSYKMAAEKFLKRMNTAAQRKDGGFGPDSGSVPSAAGVILIEALAARKLGLELISSDSLEKAARYLLDIQTHQSGQGDGAFMDDETFSHARTGAYSAMALLRYAEVFLGHCRSDKALFDDIEPVGK